MSRRSRWDFGRSREQARRGGKRRSAALSAPYSRPLRLEPLEDRRLLAVVNVLHDTSVVNSELTLREAVLAAAPGETITFDPSLFSGGAQTLQLTNVGHVGEILINKSLTIQGPGDKVLTIKAFAGVAATLGDGARIFNVDDGAGPPLKTVAISDLTLTGGDIASGLGGGAISNAENLTVTRLTVTGNSAGSASVGYHGAGIANVGGTLLVLDSSIVGNSTTFGSGAGIYSNFGTVTIERSTVSGNTAGSTGSGGGVYTTYTTTNINSSTISGNSANVGGGAVETGIGFVMTISQSTVSGNTARSNGGGVVALFGNIDVRHSTISNNRADSDNNGTGNGGGIFVNPTFSNATINHTIVAGNSRGNASTRSDITGAVTARFSIVGDNTGATITNVTGNQIGTGAVPIDAKLGALANNGGPTATHSLLAGSVAIDAGEMSPTPPPVNEQRGAPFLRIVDGDGVGGARIDVGAYERQTLPGLNLVVDTLVDESDMNYAPGDLSLREAVGLANGSIGYDKITFAAALTSGGPAEILLTRGQLLINDTADVLGPGSSLLTLRAFDPDLAIHGNGWRILEVNDGVTANLLDVEISGLAMVGGDNSAARGGGAIFSREHLRVADSKISGNRTTQVPGGSTSGSGGGISNVSGNLEVVNTSIFFNDASQSGGGIYSISGTLTVEDCSITGNDLAVGGAGYGGGIYSTGGDLSVTRTTISLNYADRLGGGISNRFANAEIFDSKIVENTSGLFGGGIGIGGSGTGEVFISDSVIDDNSAPFGAGIHNHSEVLTITRSSISGNTGEHGGGIRNVGGNVTLFLTQMLRNESVNEGGGIYTIGGSLGLDGVTISNSIAGTTGGGISNSGSALTINASTINNNNAETQGGGIRTAGATVEITNSTIGENDSSENGAGIELNGGSLTVRNSTIFRNQTDIDSDGGGLAVTAGTALLENTIVADNRSFHAGADDIVGAVSVRYSFIGIDDGATITVLGPSIIGTTTQLDPMLGQLAENGGPTMTYPVLAGSPVVDVGDPSPISPPASDQRMSPFVRIYNGDGVGGARLDIGAYERQTVAGVNLVVDSLDDLIDHKYSAGHLSLREALGLANGSVGNNTVTFAAALTSGGPATIKLTHGELWITEAVTVTGPGATLLTVDVSYSDPTFKVPNGDGARVLHVDDNVYFVTPAEVDLSGLTLTGGDTAYNGGAIYSWEDLTLRKMTITGNHANHVGGGVHAQQSILTVLESTISDNSATLVGGGLVNNAGALTVSESTVSGNTTMQSGGGIWTTSSMAGLTSASIYNSTISGNTAATGGGGIYNYIGHIEVRRSTITNNQAAANSGGGVASRPIANADVEVELTIIASNTAGNDVQVIGAGGNSFGSSGYNLVGNGNGVGAFTVATHDLVGLAPLLGPLAFNGGPTKTHALLAGSLAIDAGDPTIAFSPIVFDQRGNPFKRVFDGNGVGGAQIDIGAFEKQPIPGGVFGDYNHDGFVNALDYTVWRNTLGMGGLSPYDGADGSGNGTVGEEDFGVWKLHYGETVPPPGGGGIGTNAASDEGDGAAATIERQSASPNAAMSLAEENRSLANDLVARPHRATVGNQPQDAALLAWLNAISDAGSTRKEDATDTALPGETGEDTSKSDAAATDGVFAELGSDF